MEIYWQTLRALQSVNTEQLISRERVYTKSSHDICHVFKFFFFFSALIGKVSIYY